MRNNVAKAKPYIFVIMITLCIFTICATTSPLYGFCDESHCFFSVGKAILNGKVLYKDILEQKGLLIYLIQIPAYLISHTTFLGVWIIQSILVAISAFFAYKSALFIVEKELYAFVATCLMYLVIFVSDALASAQIVEVYLLPCFSYALFCSLKYFSKIENVQKRVFLINGIMAGIVMWTKYSLLGFYFIWMATICIFFLIKKRLKEAIVDGVIFISGMIIVSIPCILYFFVNNAVYDLIKYYLQGNIANYGTDITIINLIYGYVETIIFHLRNNFVFIGALVIGGVGVLLNRKINFFVKINLLFSVIAQFLVIFLHGSMYSYYFFAFAAFVILGTSSFVQVLFGIFRVGNGAGKTFNILMAVLGVACILVALLFKPSPRQFMKDPADLAQYKFAKIMREKTDIPTLLEYGYLDGGFYTVADIVPSTWAYCKLNWDNDDMEKDQLNTISNQLTDFVVTRSGIEIPQELFDNYRLIAETTQYRVDMQYTYYLWEKKTSEEK